MKEKKLIKLKDENFNKEERVNLIKQVFQYCKDNNLIDDNFCLYITDTLIEDSYQNSHVPIGIIANINHKDKIVIGINDSKNNNLTDEFYVENKMINNIIKSYNSKIVLIITCLHEIGHYLHMQRCHRFNLTKLEEDNRMKFNDMIHDVEGLIIRQYNNNKEMDKLNTILYKYNYYELEADFFAYSVLPMLLNDMTDCEYFKLKRYEYNIKDIDFEKIFSNLFGPTMIDINGRYLNKISKRKYSKSPFNEKIFRYINGCGIHNNLDFDLAYILINILIDGRDVNSLLSKMINNNDIYNKLTYYLNTIKKVSYIIDKKYINNKWVERNWVDEAYLNVIFTEFPTIWNKLDTLI